jgi:hypothetical protein
LDVVELTWTKPKVSGQNPSPRAGHSASLYCTHPLNVHLIDNKLIIFGGGDAEGNLFADLYFADLCKVILSLDNYL